jgi:hypothetical protein
MLIIGPLLVFIASTAIIYGVLAEIKDALIRIADALEKEK